MRIRLIAALSVLSGPVAAVAASAETACVDGRAGAYPCRGVNLVAHLPAGAIGGGPLNDIWGWIDGAGREIAIVGRYSGTSFVDITDPENPVFLGELHAHDGHGHTAASALDGEERAAGKARRTVQHETESSWRDVKVYGHYALIVGEEAGHGMQVFDLSTLPPADAVGLPHEFTETAHYGQFGNAHNIAVNVDSGFAYAVGSTSGAFPYNGGLHIIDLGDPLDPRRAGGFSADGYTHDVQCVNYQGPDQAYAGREVCLASNEDTLTIVDVTVKSGPSLVSRATYPFAAYTHQGWLSEDQRYFFMNDEADEQQTGSRTRTLIWDVSDLDNPRLAASYFAPSPAADHNNYVLGGFLFQSNYTSGLRVLDISRPHSPLEAGYFDTQPGSDAPVFQGTWSNFPYFPGGIVALSDINGGLFLLRPTVTSAAAVADLSVQLEGPGAADTGRDMIFELSVVNNGPDAAPGVELVLSLPGHGRLPPGQGGDCELGEVTAICRLGELAAGESRRVELTGRAGRVGQFRAVAFAAAHVDEQDTRDNRRTHEVEVGLPAALSGGGGAVGAGFFLLVLVRLRPFTRPAGWRAR